MKYWIISLLAVLSSITVSAQQATSCQSATGIWNFDDDYYLVVESQANNGTLSAWASDPKQPECGKACGLPANQAFYDPASGTGYILYSSYRVDFSITSNTCDTMQYSESRSCESGTCKGTWTYKKVPSIPGT
jgi:hypothetical protein